MGLLLDIVPDHGGSPENPWWMDVLENGAQSAFAAFLTWIGIPLLPGCKEKFVSPILGRPLERLWIM